MKNVIKDAVSSIFFNNFIAIVYFYCVICHFVIKKYKTFF